MTKNLKKKGETKMTRIFITTLIPAAFVCAVMQNVNGQVNAKFEAEIGKVLRDYYDAFNRRDVAAAIYADDGFIYEGGYSTTKQIKAEVRAYLQSPAVANSKDFYEMEDLRCLP